MNYGWTPSSTNGFASYKKFPVKSTTVMVPFSTWNLRSQKDNRQHPYFANFPVDLTLQHPRANAWKVCRMEIGKVRHKQWWSNMKQTSRFRDLTMSAIGCIMLWGNFLSLYFWFYEVIIFGSTYVISGKKFKVYL